MPAALLAALSLLTRPDALILLGPLVLERIYSAFWGAQRQKISLKEILVFALPVLAWGLYATLTFGSPLPHSILAKAAAYRLQPNDSLIRLIQHYATPFLEEDLLGSALAVGLGIVLYPVLFALGAVRAWKTEKRLLPWIAYPWLYLITFSLPNPLIFRWYLTPPMPSYFLFILIGLEWVLIRLFRIQSKPQVDRGEKNFRFSIFDFQLKRHGQPDAADGDSQKTAHPFILDHLEDSAAPEAQSKIDREAPPWGNLNSKIPLPEAKSKIKNRNSKIQRFLRRGSYHTANDNLTSIFQFGSPSARCSTRTIESYPGSTTGYSPLPTCVVVFRSSMSFQ